MEKEYFAHETAVVDDGAKIGKGTRIISVMFRQEQTSERAAI